MSPSTGVKFKRILFASAMVLAALAFATMFAPLSSHVYMVEEEKLYQTVTSWTEQYPSTSTSYTTEEHTKTKYTFTDDPEDSYASQDIELLVLEKEGNLLHIYLTMSHGKINRYDWTYRIAFDFDGDMSGEYVVWLGYGGCELWKYPPGRKGFAVSTLQYEVGDDDQLLHITVSTRQIDDRTSFYVWADVGYWVMEHGEWELYFADEVGASGAEYEIPNPVNLESTYAVTYTLYRTYTHTSTLSSIYTATSTETHTLTEKVSLSYWHGWLPYWLFAGAGAAVIALVLSAAIPHIKLRKAAPVVALPEGARIVKLCPSCGTENPLDAEYCLECGAKLS